MCMAFSDLALKVMHYPFCCFCWLQVSHKAAQSREENDLMSWQGSGKVLEEHVGLEILLQPFFENKIFPRLILFFSPFPFLHLCHAACGILFSHPGIEPTPSAVKVWSLNHCAIRELLPRLILIHEFIFYWLVLFAAVLKDLCPSQGCKDILFSSRSYILLFFTVRPMIHLS